MLKLNILLVLLLSLLLGDFIVFGFVVFSDRKPQATTSPCVVRVGVLPDPDRGESVKLFADFFQAVGRQPEFELVPCYAASYNEAINGFIHGSIDLLVINPAAFIDLKNRNNAKLLACQRFSAEEKDYNHAVLISARKIADLSETRGMRLLYKDRYAMGGYLVPSHYLETRLDEKPAQWFKEIAFSGGDRFSFKALIDGKVDLIAADLLSIKSSELYRDNSAKLNMLWISPALPETVICVSFQSEYFGNNALLQRIGTALWNYSRRETLYNRSSMMFEPVDYQFEQDLARLEEYLKNPHPK